MAKKLVKVCLHSSKAVQISLQFDEYFGPKKFQNSNFAQIFTKTSHPNLVWTPCILPAKLECVRCPMFRCSISILKFEFCLLAGSNSTFHVILAPNWHDDEKLNPKVLNKASYSYFPKKYYIY